jgi:transposase
MILDSVRKRWPWLKHLFADGACDRTQLMDKAAFLNFTVEIVRRSDAAQGFEVIPRRWVVERTFAWMTRWRRLVRDYEERIDCSEGLCCIIPARDKGLAARYRRQRTLSVCGIPSLVIWLRTAHLITASTR